MQNGENIEKFFNPFQNFIAEECTWITEHLLLKWVYLKQIHDKQGLYHIQQEREISIFPDISTILKCCDLLSLPIYNSFALDY